MICFFLSFSLYSLQLLQYSFSVVLSSHLETGWLKSTVMFFLTNCLDMFVFPQIGDYLVASSHRIIDIFGSCRQLYPYPLRLPCYSHPVSGDR